MIGRGKSMEKFLIVQANSFKKGKKMNDKVKVERETLQKNWKKKTKNLVEKNL